MLFLVDASITNEDDAGALKDGLDSGENVFNGKDYTYFQNAKAYVTENLVPEPTGLALIGIACVGIAGRGSRSCLGRRRG
jgi:hypothetical protein